MPCNHNFYTVHWLTDEIYCAECGEYLPVEAPHYSKEVGAQHDAHVNSWLAENGDLPF